MFVKIKKNIHYLFLLCFVFFVLSFNFVSANCGPDVDQGGGFTTIGVCRSSCSATERSGYNSLCGSGQKCCEQTNNFSDPGNGTGGGGGGGGVSGTGTGTSNGGTGSGNGRAGSGGNGTGSGGNGTGTGSTSTSGGIVPCGKGAISPCTLCHFITGFQKLVTWIKNVVFVAAMTVIIIGGIMYAVSAGSTAMMETAKKAITSSLVGFALTLCAWLIVNTIITVIAQANLGVGATNWYTFTCDTSSSALTGGSGNGTGTGSGNNAACEKWCDDAGGDADYTSKCKGGCASNANSNGNGSGCGVVGAGQSMMGWSYTQGSQRMSNGYADCSSFANRAFVNAGCSSPGNTTAEMYPKGQSVSDRSSLKPGDIVVYPGHAAVCQNAGCSTIMAASSSKGKVLTQNGDFMFNAPQGPARVLPASQYCPEGANGAGAGC
jgi:hypothetical protein